MDLNLGNELYELEKGRAKDLQKAKEFTDAAANKAEKIAAIKKILTLYKGGSVDEPQSKLPQGRPYDDIIINMLDEQLDGVTSEEIIQHVEKERGSLTFSENTVRSRLADLAKAGKIVAATMDGNSRMKVYMKANK